MLDSTVESVNRMHKRTRASLQRQRPSTSDREPPPAPDSPSESAIVAKFVTTWQSADLDSLVAILTDDVFISMPPMPFEYEGRDMVASFCQCLRRGPEVRPPADESKRSAGVRGLPARPYRHQPWSWPLRAQPYRRPNQRDDALRKQGSISHDSLPSR
jgi:hypothetical protein